MFLFLTHFPIFTFLLEHLIDLYLKWLLTRKDFVHFSLCFLYDYSFYIEYKGNVEFKKKKFREEKGL